MMWSPVQYLRLVAELEKVAKENDAPPALIEDLASFVQEHLQAHNDDLVEGCSWNDVYGPKQRLQ
jgi:hypothetical protein